MDRRTALGALVSVPVLAACRTTEPRPDNAQAQAMETPAPVTDDVVKSIEPLGFQWRTPDPFLFCAYHDDAYPQGNAQLGPAVSLAGRALGRDFVVKDGFRMYHGEVVPGFPSHPHRGFETITIVRRGLVDHSDSLGAAARYGQGDVQWLTAGKGIVHAEMFPLLSAAAPNPLELFQLWLNLPATDKFVEPHFSMLWSHDVPKTVVRDAAGRTTDVTVIAGRYGSITPPAPPPKSYASRPESDLAVWTLKMQAGARFVVPKANAGSNRTLYFFRGSDLRVGTRVIPARHGVEVQSDRDCVLEATTESEILMLQGRPLGEPVVQHGPFVMNTSAEIQQAYADYRKTRFGGWPWPKDDPVHGQDGARFARHADGRIERA